MTDKQNYFTYTDNTSDDNDKTMESLHKQIIIDGVDVTDCEYCSRYANTTIYHCEWTGECKEHPNCHYKQLKRKEQECEELKEIIDEAKNSKLDLKSFLVGEAVQNEYEQQLDQLKAENRKLKAVHSTNVALSDELFKYKAEIEELKKINKANAKSYEKHWYKLEKYKQTLTEIKEIAKPFCNACQEFEPEKKGRNCMYCNYGKILQKIRKCEVENERILSGE